MTDKNFTAIAVLMDRSGSMQTIRSDAEGALKSFIEEQAKVEGSCTIRLSEFDTVYNDVYPSVSLPFAPAYSLRPRGGTALYDGIGRLINDFGTELEAIPEPMRPGNVLVVIVTDGQENSSREFNKGMVRAMIQNQSRVYNWNFLFLAANQDAVLTGGNLGIDAGSSLTFGTSTAGVQGSWNAVNNYTTALRSGVNYEFTEQDRASSGV